jgi:hypothetical protein
MAPLPNEIPTVRVTGTYRGPDGRALKGSVTFTGPPLLTFSESDLFIAGPVVATLDESGQIIDADGNVGVRLPATDAPDMNPTGWTYTVKENLTGVVGARTYSMVLPKDTLNNSVDLADVAPADPTTPNYVAVPGPSAYEVAVAEGFSGTEAQWLDSLVGRGAKAYWGSTAPAASLGLDGDSYAQYTTETVLGLTTTTVAMWAKSAGAWAKVSGDVRGSAWYVTSSPTQSTGVPYGDMLLRADTGDVFQKTEQGWSARGNIKGPKGDTGAQGVQGIQGVKGDTGATGPAGSKVYKGPVGSGVGVDGDVSINTTTGGLYWRENGTWVLQGSLIGPQGPAGPEGPKGDKGDPGSGSVNSVNGDLGPDIVLDAGDVGAVPATEKGAVNGVATLGTDGKVPSSQLPTLADPNAVTSVNGQSGPTVTLTAANVGALATSARGAVNGVASLDASGDVPIGQVPNVARNEWNAKALGFEAWSCDPYGVANPVAKYLKPNRLYFVGFNITESTTVDRIVLFARGYGGVSTNRYRAGIYRENGAGTGTKVVESASVALTMAGQETGALPAQAANHIGAVPITIAQTVLTPGRYWVAFSLVVGGTADFAYFHVQNESPVATANFFMTNSPWARAWYLEAQANAALPTTANQAASTSLADHDIPIVALANV